MEAVAWVVAGAVVTAGVVGALVYWCIQEERERRTPPPPGGSEPRA